MIKAVILDLDGTLLDTLEGIADAFNHCLEQLGFPARPVAAFRQYVGDGVYKCAERCLPEGHRNKTTIDQLVALERDRYGAVWQDVTRPYEGIPEALKTLKDAGIALTVLSNKDQNYAADCIRLCFPDLVFDHVIGYSEATPHKPDPTGAERIRAALALDPREIAFVGDTHVDITTARACNMLAVGVLWGFRDEAELRAAGADVLVADPATLTRVILQDHQMEAT